MRANLRSSPDPYVVVETDLWRARAALVDAAVEWWGAVPTRDADRTLEDAVKAYLAFLAVNGSDFERSRLEDTKQSLMKMLEELEGGSK